jgi:RNA polymerase sigma-70 factor (ECF subfamily)
MTQDRPLVDLDEPELIRRARGGDQPAFGELVWRHQGALRAYLSRSCAKADVVDDLAQEAFVAAYQSLSSYRGEVSLRHWLYGIARNKWLVYLRTEQRRRKREANRLELELARWQSQQDDGPEAWEAHDQEVAALRRCLDKLPAQSATLIREVYFHGRTAADVAQEHGRKAGAVRMTLMRARQALRKCMEQPVPGTAS